MHACHTEDPPPSSAAQSLYWRAKLGAALEERRTAPTLSSQLEAAQLRQQVAALQDLLAAERGQMTDLDEVAELQAQLDAERSQVDEGSGGTGCFQSLLAAGLGGTITATVRLLVALKEESPGLADA